MIMTSLITNQIWPGVLKYPCPLKYLQNIPLIRDSLHPHTPIILCLFPKYILCQIKVQALSMKCIRMGKCFKHWTNELRLFAWKNYDVSDESISVVMSFEILAEHSTRCQPCSYTNTAIDLIPLKLHVDVKNDIFEGKKNVIYKT